MGRKSLDNALSTGLLSIGQVCKLTAISRTTIQRWVDRRDIESFNIPDTNEIRINAHSLYMFLLTEGFPITNAVKQAADNYKKHFYQQDDSVVVNLLTPSQPKNMPAKNMLGKIFPVPENIPDANLIENLDVTETDIAIIPPSESEPHPDELPDEENHEPPCPA